MQRQIRADKGRIEFPDGTIVEGEGLEADEWPFRGEGEPPQWRVLGFPLEEVLRKIEILSQATTTLYQGNGEVLLHLVNVGLLLLKSADSEDYLMGEEEPAQAGV